MSQYCNHRFLIFSLLLLCKAYSKGFEDYNPQIYPDSQVDFGQCRLTEPSLVCDPNFLLNEQDGHDGILLLHEATQHVLFNTQCVCNSMGFAASGTCIHKTRGYPISIAILKKIRGSVYKKDNPDELIEVFSKTLRRKLKRGQCEDDILIVYSIGGGKVFTVVGGSAKQKLHSKVVSEVENLAQTKHFNNGNHTGGLLLMVDIFGRVLKGENYSEALPPANEAGFSNGLKKIIPTWSTWLIVVLVIGVPTVVILFIIICASLFAFKRYCKRTHQYEAGRRV